MDEMVDTLKKGAESLDISLDEQAISRFSTFTNELVEWNKVMNLTAIKEPNDIALKHFVDSIAVFKYAKIQNGAKIADVGCGAGFPGIPMKIVRNDIKLTCIDSLNKRVKFMEQLLQKLELADCDCVHIRAEEAGAKAEFREKYDFAMARAVAQLRVLAEYCVPLLKVGGAFISMKGADAKEEVNEAKNAVKLLGAEIEQVYEYNLPLTDMGRTIIIIRKTAKTPQKYPRISAKISKNPL